MKLPLALSLLAAWLIGTSCILSAQCTPRALAIGNSVFNNDRSFAPKPPLHSRQDAEAFSDWFRKHAVCSGGSDPRAAPVVETLTDAGAVAIRHKLQELFLKASSRDEVFIFISGRGIRAPYLGEDGYLLGADGLPGRLHSSAISLWEISRMIPEHGVSRIYLFADVSRDLPHVNEIVSAMQSALAANASLSAVLSASPGQISNDTDRFSEGLFTHFLMEELASGDGKVSVPALYRTLREKVIRASPPKNRQVPTAFGSTAAVTDAGRHVLIASLDAPPAEAFDDPADSTQTLQLLSDAARYEERAQGVLLRYGEGNQFPDDPDRPNQDDFDSAAADYELALRAHSGMPDSEMELKARDSLRARMLFSEARALIFRRQYQQARDLLDKARAADPLLPEPWNAIGICWLEESNFTQAAKAFRNSIALAQRWGYPRLNLALTLTEAGSNAAAEAEYRSAIRAIPAQPYLYFNLGILLARMNRRHEAERQFLDSQKVFESQAQTYLDEAALLKGDTARHALEHAATVKRNEGEAWNALGSLAHGSKAARNYEAALRLNPNLYAAEYNLGIFELRSRHYARAVMHFEAVTRADASFADTARLLECARHNTKFRACRAP